VVTRRARTAMAVADGAGQVVHPSYHRPNRRQIDRVAKIVQHLVGIGQRSLAVHTGQRLGDNCRVGIAGNRSAATLDPRHPGADCCASSSPLGWASVRSTAANSNCPASSASSELRLQLGDATLCRLTPPPRHQDQRILLGVAQLAEVGQCGHG
jgi:hypothetical protein